MKARKGRSVRHRGRSIFTGSIAFGPGKELNRMAFIRELNQLEGPAAQLLYVNRALTGGYSLSPGFQRRLLRRKRELLVELTLFLNRAHTRSKEGRPPRSLPFLRLLPSRKRSR